MKYRLRYHDRVSRDLRQIAEGLTEIAGAQVAYGKLSEIRRVVRSLADVPHKGSLRTELFADLRSIPAAENAVITFAVDDAARTVMIYVITYGGADWVGRVQRRR